MTARLQDNQLKGMFFIVLFIALILQSLLTSAQTYQLKSNETYKGLVASFATRFATVSSNIEKINQANLVQSGGQVGLIFGNSVVRTKIGLLGYYSSTASIAGTTDLYQSNAAVNFYPLSLLAKKTFLIEPYILGSVDYDQYKFRGFYLNDEPGQTNYSQSKAPFLGKIKQVNSTVGIGLELKLKDHYDFIHFFTEVRYGMNLSSKTRNIAFSNTEISNQTQVIAGISFGAHR